VAGGSTREGKVMPRAVSLSSAALRVECSATTPLASPRRKASCSTDSSGARRRPSSPPTPPATQQEAAHEGSPSALVRDGCVRWPPARLTLACLYLQAEFPVCLARLLELVVEAHEGLAQKYLGE
jgi:hypothetical protein